MGDTPGHAVAPPDEALVLLAGFEWADVPPNLHAGFLADLNIEREFHRRLIRAAAALVRAIESHPGDAVPRGALAPALARLRPYVFRDADPPSAAP